jgi:hypothetical protein
MIDTKIFATKRKDGKFAVELSICMQHNLDVYVEPVVGKPSTYENEHKRYFYTRDRLEDLIETAEDRARDYLDTVFRCKGYEAAGLTYKQMSVANGGTPNKLVTDNKYTADEDLTFLYGQLQILYDFIYEVRCCFDREGDNARSE